MPTVEPILSHVIPFVLVVFRLGGLFISAPMLTSAGVPMKVKALLAVALAAAVYPTIPAAWQGSADISWAELLSMVVGEAMVGGVMGLIAAVPVLMMDLAGVTSGQMMGMGLARVYNPEMDSDADVLGQLLFMLATGAFVAVGGLEWLFVSLAHTFARLPPGGMAMSAAPLDLLTATVTSGCEVALRVTTPVIGTILLLVVVFGAIGKTMPQINVMSVGFIIKIAAGLSVLAAAIFTVESVIGDEVVRVLRLVGME